MQQFSLKKGFIETNKLHECIQLSDWATMFKQINKHVKSYENNRCRLCNHCKLKLFQKSNQSDICCMTYLDILTVDVFDALPNLFSSNIFWIKSFSHYDFRNSPERFAKSTSLFSLFLNKGKLFPNLQSKCHIPLFTSIKILYADIWSIWIRRLRQLRWILAHEKQQRPRIWLHKL